MHRWLRTLLSTVTLRQVMLAIAAVAVLASGLFGGLATATPDGPAELKAGTELEAAPFDLTIERVRWLPDLGESEPDPGRRYIGVVATLTNSSDHPVHLGDVKAALRLVDVPGTVESESGDSVEPADVMVIADSSALDTAPPGVEFEVVFLWTQSTAFEPPTTVDVAVRAQTWRQSRIDDQEMWFDPTVTHRGALAVKKGADA